MRQLIPKKIWTKGIALFVAGLFLAETVLWAAPAPFADVVRATPENSRDGVRVDALLEKIQIPSSIGTIQETYSRPESRVPSSVLVHIEDAHGEPDAQKNIEAILNHLNKKLGVQTFFLEGAWNKLDPVLLKFSDEENENKKILAELTEKGIVGGPENFLWGQSNNALSPMVSGYGIEDLDLYKKNLDQFRAVMRARKKSETFLKEMKAGLLTKASQVFNPELADYFRGWSFHEEVQSDYSAHLRALAELAEKHLKLDLSDAREQYDWPMLVRFFKLKELEKNKEQGTKDKESFFGWLNKHQLKNYEECFDRESLFVVPCSLFKGDAREFFEIFYEQASQKGFRFKDYPALSLEWGKQILAQELDAPSLLKEIEKLESLLLEKLAQTSDEKKLVAKYREYLLLRKLLHLELSKEEWKQFQTIDQRLPTTELGTGSVLGAQPWGLTPMVSQVVETARQFYQTAEARDAAMVTRVMDWIKKEKIEKAAIITGGFHSQGLSDLLKQKNISYVRIQPRIAEIKGRGDYLKQMTAVSHLRGVSAAEPGIVQFPEFRGALPAIAQAVSSAGRSENRTNSIATVIQMLETHYSPLGPHSRMVGHLSRLIAAQISPRLTKKELQDIADAGLLHDAGKVRVFPELLKKRGKLLPEEKAEMDKHPELGERMIRSGPYQDLYFAIPTILHHHERWDGKGYPHGLKGEAIPLAARIVAVADAFDALISPRSYKKGKTWREAWEIIAGDAGTHFDPMVVIALHRAILELRKSPEIKKLGIQEKKLPRAFRDWVISPETKRSEARLFHPIEWGLGLLFRGEEQAWRETYNGIDPRSPREEELIAQSIKAVYALKEPTVVNFVIPMYKEEKRLAPRSAENPDGENALVFKVRQLEQLRLVNPLFDYKLTLVDDGSPDEKTYEMAQAMRELLTGKQKDKIKILRISPEEKKRIGSRKGGAVLYGMRHALQNPVSGAKQLVGYTDVDDSANLMLTGLLLDPILSGKADASAAARRGPGAEARGRSIAALVSSRLYNRAIRFMLPDLRGIYDTQTGFKLFTEEALASVLPWMRDGAWSFDSELLSLTAMHGFKIAKPLIAWFDSRDASQFSHKALQNGKEALGRVFQIQRPQVARFKSLVRFLKKHRYFHLDDLRREISAYRDVSEEAIFKEIRAVGRRKLVRLPKGKWEGFYKVLDPETGLPTGHITSYSYKHAKRTPEGKPVYFPAVSVFVADEKGRILAQHRRLAGQDETVDATATGHVEIDETPIQTAVNELREELGLVVSEKELIPVFDPTGRDFFVQEMDLASGGKDAGVRYAYVHVVPSQEMGWLLFQSRARTLNENIVRFEGADFKNLEQDAALNLMRYEPGLRIAFLKPEMAAAIAGAAKNQRSEIRDPVEDKIRAILDTTSERELHMSDVIVSSGLFEPTDPGFMKAVERKLEIDPGREMTLLDIGHGQGLFGLRLALKYPRLKIIGVELHHGLFDSSRRLVSAAEKLGFIRKGQVQYFGGDFFDPEFRDDIQSADFVYYYNQSFSDEDFLAQHLARYLKTNARVVIYASLPDEDEWDELVDEDDSLSEFDYRRDDEEDALPGNLLLRELIRTRAFHHILPDDEIQSIQVLEKMGARKRSEARTWLSKQEKKKVDEIEKIMDAWVGALAAFSAAMPKEKFWVKNVGVHSNGERDEKTFQLSFGQWLFRHHYGNLAQNPTVMITKIKAGARPDAEALRRFRSAVKQIRHGMPSALTVLAVAIDKIDSLESLSQAGARSFKALGLSEKQAVGYQSFIHFILHKYMVGPSAEAKVVTEEFKKHTAILENQWALVNEALEELEAILSLNSTDWSQVLLNRYREVQFRSKAPVKKVNLVYDENKTRLEWMGRLLTFYYDGSSGWDRDAVLNVFESKLRQLGFAPSIRYEQDSKGALAKPMILVLDDKDAYFRPIEALYGKDYQIIKVKRVVDAVWAVKNLPRFAKIISDTDLLGSPFNLLGRGRWEDVKGGLLLMKELEAYFLTPEGKSKIPYGNGDSHATFDVPAAGSVVLHSTSFENFWELLGQSFSARIKPQPWNLLAWFKFAISPLDRVLAFLLGRSATQIKHQVPEWVSVQPKSKTYRARSELRSKQEIVQKLLPNIRLSESFGAYFTEEELERIAQNILSLVEIFKTLTPQERKIILNPDLLAVLAGTKSIYLLEYLERADGEEPSQAFTIWKNRRDVLAKVLDTGKFSEILTTDFSAYNRDLIRRRFEQEGHLLVQKGVVAQEELAGLTGENAHQNISLWIKKNIGSKALHRDWAEGFLLGYSWEDISFYAEDMQRLRSREQIAQRILRSKYDFVVLSRDAEKTWPLINKWDVVTDLAFQTFDKTNRKSFRQALPKRFKPAYFSFPRFESRSEARGLDLKVKLFKPARAEVAVREAIEEMVREIRDGDGRVLVEWQNANGNKSALANFFVRSHEIQGSAADELAKQIVPRLHSSPPLQRGEFFAVKVIPFGRPEIVFSRRSEIREEKKDEPLFPGWTGIPEALLADLRKRLDEIAEINSRLGILDLPTETSAKTDAALPAEKPDRLNQIAIGLVIGVMFTIAAVGAGYELFKALTRKLPEKRPPKFSGDEVDAARHWYGPDFRSEKDIAGKLVDGEFGTVFRQSGSLSVGQAVNDKILDVNRSDLSAERDGSVPGTARSEMRDGDIQKEAAEKMAKQFGVDFEAIRRHGFFAFDMQKTLVARKEIVTEGMRDLLIWLLSEGVPVVVISANSREEVWQQLMEPVLAALRELDRLDLAENMIIYANSGTSKYWVDKNDQLQVDEAFSRQFLIRPEVELAVKRGLKELANQRFFLESTEEGEFLRVYQKDKEKDGLEVLFQFPWLEANGGKAYDPSVVVRLRDEAEVQAPYLVRRGLIAGNETGEGTALAVRQFLPAQREKILPFLEKVLERELGLAAKQIVLSGGGTSTIDVFNRKANKAFAFRDATEHFQKRGRSIDLRYAVYHGDEVWRKSTGARGNDTIVLDGDFGRDTSYQTFRVVAVNPKQPEGLLPGEEKRVAYIGGEQAGTEFYLARLKETVTVQRSSKIVFNEGQAEAWAQVANFINQLKDSHVMARLHGRDLFDMGSDLKAFAEHIQHYSAVKNPEDLSAILSAKLNSLRPGKSFSRDERALAVIFDALFDREAFLRSYSPEHPFRVVVFRGGRGASKFTEILKKIPGVQVSVLLGAVDDGRGWYIAARDFHAPGIPDAGKALLDLAQDTDLKKFLELRFRGENSEDLQKDLQLLLNAWSAPSPGSVSFIYPRTREIYESSLKLVPEKRNAVVRSLEMFLRTWQTEFHQSRFSLDYIPLRSLVILGSAWSIKKTEDVGYWQKAVDELGKLLDVKPGDRVLFPTRKQQHLVALAADGTIYFAETGINEYRNKKAPFVGLWLFEGPISSADLTPHLNPWIQIKPISFGFEEMGLYSEGLRREILETTRRVSPEYVRNIADVLSKLSTNGTRSKKKLFASQEVLDAIEKANLIVYANTTFESNIGSSLIVPGIGQAIYTAPGARVLFANPTDEAEPVGTTALEVIKRLLLYAGGASPYTGHAAKFVEFVLGIEDGHAKLDPKKTYIPFNQPEIHRVFKGVSTIGLNLELTQPIERPGTDYRLVGREWGFYDPELLVSSLFAIAGLKQGGYQLDPYGRLKKADTGLRSEVREILDLALMAGTGILGLGLFAGFLAGLQKLSKIFPEKQKPTEEEKAAAKRQAAQRHVFLSWINRYPGLQYQIMQVNEDRWIQAGFEAATVDEARNPKMYTRALQDLDEGETHFQIFGRHSVMRLGDTKYFRGFKNDELFDALNHDGLREGKSQAQKFSSRSEMRHEAAIQSVAVVHSEALTHIPTSYFGRNGYSLSYAVQRAIENMKAGEDLNILTVGSSAGHEGYDVAMIVADYLEATSKKFKTRITVTDIDPRLVAIAKRGVYKTQEAKRPLKQNYINDLTEEDSEVKFRKFFKSVDEMTSRILTAEEFAARWNIQLVFEPLDALDSKHMASLASSEKYNLIIARNVHYAEVDDFHSQYLFLENLANNLKLNGFAQVFYGNTSITHGDPGVTEALNGLLTQNDIRLYLADARQLFTKTLLSSEGSASARKLILALLNSVERRREASLSDEDAALLGIIMSYENLKISLPAVVYLFLNESPAAAYVRLRMRERELQDPKVYKQLLELILDLTPSGVAPAVYSKIAPKLRDDIEVLSQTNSGVLQEGVSARSEARQTALELEEEFKKRFPQDYEMMLAVFGETLLQNSAIKKFFDKLILNEKHPLLEKRAQYFAALLRMEGEGFSSDEYPMAYQVQRSKKKETRVIEYPELPQDFLDWAVRMHLPREEFATAYGFYVALMESEKARQGAQTVFRIRVGNKLGDELFKQVRDARKNQPKAPFTFYKGDLVSVNELRWLKALRFPNEVRSMLASAGVKPESLRIGVHDAKALGRDGVYDLYLFTNDRKFLSGISRAIDQSLTDESLLGYAQIKILDGVPTVTAFKSRFYLPYSKDRDLWNYIQASMKTFILMMEVHVDEILKIKQPASKMRFVTPGYFLTGLKTDESTLLHYYLTIPRSAGYSVQTLAGPITGVYQPINFIFEKELPPAKASRSEIRQPGTFGNVPDFAKAPAQARMKTAEVPGHIFSVDFVSTMTRSEFRALMDSYFPELAASRSAAVRAKALHFVGLAGKVGEGLLVGGDLAAKEGFWDAAPKLFPGQKIAVFSDQFSEKIPDELVSQVKVFSDIRLAKAWLKTEKLTALMSADDAVEHALLRKQVSDWVVLTDKRLAGLFEAIGLESFAVRLRASFAVMRAA